MDVALSGELVGPVIRRSIVHSAARRIGSTVDSHIVRAFPGPANRKSVQCQRERGSELPPNSLRNTRARRCGFTPSLRHIPGQSTCPEDSEVYKPRYAFFRSS